MKKYLSLTKIKFKPNTITPMMNILNKKYKIDINQKALDKVKTIFNEINTNFLNLKKNTKVEKTKLFFIKSNCKTIK